MMNKSTVEYGVDINVVDSCMDEDRVNLEVDGEAKEISPIEYAVKEGLRKIKEDNNKMNVVNSKSMEYNGNSKILQPNKRAFLAAIAETGNITGASKITSIARVTHYDWMQTDMDYAAAFKVAMETAAENLELEARRRATKGTARPVFYKGEECGTVQEYSDTLLIFLLKGAMPDKYSERYQSIMDINVTLEDKTPEERKARLIDMLSKKQIADAIDMDPVDE